MVQITTKGMHCKSCEMLIDDALEDANIKGTSDFKTNTVNIENIADMDKAKRIIQKEGF